MNLDDLTGVLEYVKEITKDAGQIILEITKRIFRLITRTTKHRLPRQTENQMII